MATIPIGGLATGIDTNSLIQQLMAADQQPITLLQARQVKYEALGTTFRDLNSRVDGLKAATTGLTDREKFFARSVTSSADTVATATAAPGALRGTFTLTASALARGSIAAAATTKANLTDTVATTDGTFAFRLGPSGSLVSVAVSGTTTLDQLAKAINDKNAGVKAAVVNVGTASSPAYKLTLASSGTGADNNIVVVTDGTTLGVTTTQTAIDAAFTINGLGSFTRASNTFSDVLDGVTITLKAASGSTDLGLDYDKTATQGRVQKLVDAYNDVIRTIDTQAAVGKDAKGAPTSGPLTGDATARSIRLRLAGIAGSVLGGRFASLAAIGITTQSDGTLALDGAKFQKAIGDDADAVRDLVAGTAAQDGIAARFATETTATTKALTGAIAARQDGISSTVRSLQQQIDAAQTRLDATEQMLRAKFSNLEQIVSQLQSSGASLLSQLSQLNSNSSKSTK